jgi:membrane-associated phospholipid phosphatase
MRRNILAFVLAFGLATSAGAQVLPTPKERTAAHITSWVTVLTLEGLDTLASFRSDDRTRAFVLQGVRLGIAQGGVALIKWAAPMARPCTPTHECGSDGEMSGFPSGHMALACSTLGGPGLSITIPLAGATGLGRFLAWRHFPSQIAAGCIIGALASRIR